MFRRMVIVSVCTALFAWVAESAIAKGNGGVLKGRTAQHRGIRFGLRSGHVDLKHVTVKLRCKGGDILIDDESGFAPSPLKGGRVNDFQVGSTDRVWIRGHLRGRSLRGTIRVRDRWGHHACDSGWVGFHTSGVGS